MISTISTKEKYWYDYEGQRLKKVEFHSNGMNTTTYYVSKSFVRIINSSGTYDEVYYYDEYDLIGKKDSEGKKFYHPDHLGSTTLVTDEQENVVEETVYDPYGAVQEGGDQRYDYEGQRLKKTKFLECSMDVLLDTKKSVDKNASFYFESAKKARTKAAKAGEALEKTKKELERLKKNKDQHTDDTATIKKVKKRKWYEKFRWFLTSDNRLVIGGRDATTNEIIIKKHADPGDLVFHTDMAGSPFFVLKTENKEIPENILEEVADATCSFSKAFQLGLKTQSVFYVFPEQITKEAKAGEYLTKGAFMIKGKTNYVKNKINVAIGLTEENEIMCGPVESIKPHCKEYVVIEQGQNKASDAAKKIRKKISADLDDIIRALPTGTMKVL